MEIEAEAEGLHLTVEPAGSSLMSRRYTESRGSDWEV